jgi:hypothetical protein
VIASFGADKDAPKTPATTKLMTEVVHALIKDVKEMEDVAKRLADQLRKDAAAAQALADAENNAAAAGGSGAASFMSGMTKEQTASRMTYSVKCQSERTVMPYNGKDPDAEDDGTRLQSKNGSHLQGSS